MTDTPETTPAPHAEARPIRRRPAAPGPGPTKPEPHPDEPLGIPPAHNSGAVLALHADVVRDARERLAPEGDADADAERPPAVDMAEFVEPLARTLLQAAATHAVGMGADLTRGHLDAVRAACVDRAVEALSGLGEALASLAPRAGDAGAE